MGTRVSETGSTEDHMGVQAHDLRARDDFLDRSVYARMRLRAASNFEANPRLRTCTSCGELVEMPQEPGGWSVCPLCGRYA